MRVGPAPACGILPSTHSAGTRGNRPNIEYEPNSPAASRRPRSQVGTILPPGLATSAVVDAVRDPNDRASDVPGFRAHNGFLTFSAAYLSNHPQALEEFHQPLQESSLVPGLRGHV